MTSLIVLLLRNHPRGCGEHTILLDDQGKGWGSSPRMRGALGGGLSKSAGLRIIPADARSTAGAGVSGVDLGDHPRGCGEH